MSFMKGGYKGGGNNRGTNAGNNGGRLDDYCNHCNLYGHMIRDCRKKDAEMKGKGKSKDSWNSTRPKRKIKGAELGKGAEWGQGADGWKGNGKG